MDDSFRESEVPDRQIVANLLSDVLGLTLSGEGWHSVSAAVADLSAAWTAKDSGAWRGAAKKLRRLGSRAIPIGADLELSGPPDGVRDQISDLVHTLGAEEWSGPRESNAQRG
ncbi:hypothetical protein FXN61_39230 [Lentzea sp. PSKA42]|uniref:CATRA-Associated Small Protein domain-containing protein n=1 Tax=Lentzea indica TaxID=2604800 RepID=A0ABX1FTW0_9PSEU|nr:CATRA system-associated protein [Lentzea indica]NKE62447.1 hypothetical protein [Lentzea indica]